MLRTLKLLLPALIPSWNFFDVIAPAPRIQFALLKAANGKTTEWQEFRPRPARVSFLQMLGRMFWNPVWNESLFMVSCAERLMEAPTLHSEDEILKRIEAELRHDHLHDLDGTYLQFRLLVVLREGSRLQEELVYESRIRLLSDQDPHKDVA